MHITAYQELKSCMFPCEVIRHVCARCRSLRDPGRPHTLLTTISAQLMHGSNTGVPSQTAYGFIPPYSKTICH